MKTISLIAASAAIIAFSACSRSKATHTVQVPDIEVSEAVTDSVTIYKKFPGTLTAGSSVDVVARVNGIITSKNYNSGDFVRKGQLLFTIESDTYRDAVRQAEATVATARSEHEYAVKHLAALEKAFRSNAVSEMELEQGRSAEREAEAAIRSAEAALSTARTRLGYCRVTAPIDGNVTTNALSVGNYVSGEGSPVVLCSIYDNRQVTANFAVEDASLARQVADFMPAEETPVPVKFTQRLKHSYTGTYSYVAPEMNTSTGTMPINLSIENPYDELRPGMYVEVLLPVSVEPEAVLVRDGSLSSDQLGKYLYTVNDSNKVVYTPVKVGEMANDSMRVVESGIRAGVKYVTSAMLKVRDGMTVNPIESSAK
ncbi:MAG: efflux RND transporter periplasmic adaptor subunit [Muribaculaceae bacterium]|nr:efflux RND transporter periplasmic adaptor subunit [Muribaculaceae bacterium]